MTTTTIPRDFDTIIYGRPRTIAYTATFRLDEDPEYWNISIDTIPLEMLHPEERTIVLSLVEEDTLRLDALFRLYGKDPL